MIRLSKLADYAFILLTQMAQEGEKSWAASTLSTQTTLPLPTVAKLMKLLAKGNIVLAQRGASGGYRLARDVKEIGIADVIEAVDGPISLTECVGGCHPTCAAKKLCGMRSGWEKINEAVRASLASVTLEEIAPKRD